MQFEPYAFDHAARLIGQRPWTVSRDAGLLARAQLAVRERYRATCLVVGVDLYNLEAEAYGCQVEEPPGEEPPTIIKPLLKTAAEMAGLRLDPERDGRLPLILEAAAKVKAACPAAQVRVPLAGPFTIAGHLLGLERAILALITEPEPMQRGLNQLAANQARYARAALERGLGLTFFDSTVAPPLLSPPLFRQLIVPGYQLAFAQAGEQTAQKTQVIVGGDCLPILGDLFALNPGYLICPRETNQEEFMVQAEARPDIFVRVNMNPAVFLAGQEEAARAEAQRAAAIAARRANTSVGALLPLDADPAIVAAVADHLEQI